MHPISVVFLGTAEFAVPSLRALHASAEYSVELVVTQPDKPVGRKQILTQTPVKRAALELGLPVTDNLDDVRNCSAQIGVVVAYGKLLPENVLAHFTYGIVNVHPSLLPTWRGPSPIQAALLAGDTTTGVTIMLVDSGMDSGPILSQHTYDIKPTETADELHDILAAKGATALIQTISGYIRGDLSPVPQSESAAGSAAGSVVSYSSIIKRTDGKITGQDDPVEIMRKLRAYTPWPGVYGMWHNKRLKIIAAHIDDTTAVQPKLIVDELQVEGKPVMSFQDFRQGHSDFTFTDVT